MTTSRFRRIDRRRFVASSAIGGAAILTAGSLARGAQGTRQPAALALQDGSAEVPMFRGNAARTGVMPGPGPDDSNGVEVLWTFEITHDYLPPSPAVVNGVVHVGSADGNLYAIGSNDGIERWRFATGDLVGSSPAVVDGVVYAGSVTSTFFETSEESEYLYAINAEDGTERWRLATGSWVFPPAVVDGIVYVGSGLYLYAVNVGDGTERWRFASRGVLSPPTVADGVVYFMGNGGLYAVTVEDGSELWRVELSNQGAISLTMVDGVVYVMNGIASPRPADLIAIDASDGTERWRFETDGASHSAPAVMDGMVYFGGENLYAVNVTDGTERWQFVTGESIGRSPVVAEGVVYVGSSEGNLYAVNADDGTERWRFAIGSDSVRSSSPVVVNGVIYVVSEDGTLYAIGARVPRLSSGGTARVTETTLLRGGPAPTAVERSKLEPNTVVTIMGETETTGDVEWWPVVVDETGEQGWVEASKLEPLTSGPEPTATS